MSRMGKKPVSIPEGVDVKLESSNFTAKGKRGEETISLSEDVIVKMENNEILVEPRSKSKHSRAMWGTERSRIINVIDGVTEGYTKDMELRGVGYRAAVQGKTLVMQLGFSHEVKHDIPEGITVTCEKPTTLKIEGTNKQRVGQFAANVRGYRPPEPYKGKGVRYTDEYVLRKEGKKK